MWLRVRDSLRPCSNAILPGQASRVAEGALLLLPPLALRRRPDAPPTGALATLLLGVLRGAFQQGRRCACNATATGSHQSGWGSKHHSPRSIVCTPASLAHDRALPMCCFTNDPCQTGFEDPHLLQAAHPVAARRRCPLQRASRRLPPPRPAPALCQSMLVMHHGNATLARSLSGVTGPFWPHGQHHSLVPDIGSCMVVQ